MGLIAKFFIFVGAVAAVVFAAAVGAHIYLADKPQYLNEAAAGCYLLALVGVWAAMLSYGWRRRGKTAGLAVLMALFVVVAYGGLMYLTVGSWQAVLNTNPLEAMATNVNYLVAGIGSVVVLMLMVTVLGLMLLRALAGRGGPAWGLAGFGLAVASGAFAAALAMLVYGSLRDPKITELGNLVLTASFYAHIAAWLMMALALFASLRAARPAAAVAAAAGTGAAVAAAPAAAAGGAPASAAPPVAPPAAAAKPEEAPTKPMAAPAKVEEAPAPPPAPVAPLVAPTETQPKPLAADERTVRATPKPAASPPPAADPPTAPTKAPSPKPASVVAPASAPAPAPAPAAPPPTQPAAGSADKPTQPAPVAAKPVTVVRAAKVQPVNQAPKPAAGGDAPTSKPSPAKPASPAIKQPSPKPASDGADSGDGAGDSKT